MPESGYYTVTQEREVRISASSPAEAVALADRVFNQEAIVSDQTPGRILSNVRELNIEARRDI